MAHLNLRCLSIFTICLWLGCAERDFQFENGHNDELQIILTEPPEEIGIIPRSTYAKEVSQCPYDESKTMLSLVLKSHDWDDIVDNKKNRALNKLSKFFAVPKEFIKLDSVTRRDMFEMSKRSLKEGLIKMDTERALGKIEFMIGCGQSYFKIGQPISKQIAQQMRDGSIDDISGIDFGWWVIWKKKVSNRVQRFRREIEGSGEDDADYYDDYEESVTEQPTVSSHPHRHHHGITETDVDDTTPSKIENAGVATTTARTITTTTNVQVSDYDYDTNKASYEGKAEEDAKVFTTILPETTTPRIETTTPITTTQASTTTTTQKPTTRTTTATTTTTEYVEPEPVNAPPMIKNRLPKIPVTAGKPFSYNIPANTFYDNEDETNLKLELHDKNGNPLKPNSWIQFNPEKREIYGLPLEDSVSRYQYRLNAIDSKNESVTETLDISVQQHKGHRSVNHEIMLGVKINEKFKSSIDWQIRLIRGIVEALNDSSMSSIVVREIRHQVDSSFATFIYTNESLPKDKCPEEKLDELVKRLDIKKLTDSLSPELAIKTVSAQPIGPCQKLHVAKPKPTPQTKNYPPVPRNQVDRVNATIGQLLVYKVPFDTFYDPEDHTDLKLSLLTTDRGELDPRHWLQFDSKNQEFFGIPKTNDYGLEEYLLVAEDHEGKTANDALVVVVNHPIKRDYSVLIRVTLAIPYETFNNSHMQRRFVERIAQLFGDVSTSNIQIKSIQHLNTSGHTLISFYNTTLHKIHQRCPEEEEIDAIRNVWHNPDYSIREKAKKIIGSEFQLHNVDVSSTGYCHVAVDNVPHEYIPTKPEDKKTSSFKDDYLLTFVLPAVIILAMLLLASIIACVLHRRRLTGKMELGDEEERRSFRSKGIPVIFQDELDEKPEIGNKSPIILKDEKPPLLPPSYNSDNDVDEYVPPPAVVMGGREVRGKSPVTPSYRRPPPYVSP